MEYAIKVNDLYESIIFQSDVVETHGKNIILQAKIDDDEFVDYLKVNGVTNIDLPVSVYLKLISKYPFTYTIPEMEPRYINKNKIEDYLYEITYGNIDYEYAYRYFNPTDFGGCSAIRNGNWFGRNFDWLYNNQVLFVVHTPTSLNRLAVLGVSGIIPGVEQDNVDDDDIIIDDVDMFKLVPFYLLDGINEKGVFCTHNVVSINDYATDEIVAKKEERYRVAIPMLVRFILDRFNSAMEAIKYITDYVTLYFTDEMIDLGYASHFLIGDCSKTYVMEFVGGVINIIPQTYITNFSISGVTFNKDNTIIYPNPTESGIYKYDMGLERWDIISNSLSNTLESMRGLLDSIKYSNTYSEPFWYSEIVKMTDDNGSKITVDTDPELCTNAKLNMKYLYNTRDRDDPKIWITCHSSIYDIKRKCLHITNLENEQEYTFKI